MTDKTNLHFTLGPVQGFIADARRTRDFWAGSFLLSWLSGCAMEALTKKGGRIIFPEVADDELFQAIKNPASGCPPYIGSLPNRFKADVTDVEGDPAEICSQAIRQHWLKLADTVYSEFITDEIARNAKDGRSGVKAIWDRQVRHFWDINWVIGPDSEDNGSWLDQRKNWRTYWGPDEGGDLCRLMGRYQEISGFHRIGTKDKQTEFWRSFAKQVGALNLRNDERLCAIALIKRLFPLVAGKVLGWQPGGQAIDIKHWPSVSYIAAVPWLKEVATLSNSDHSNYYLSADKFVDGDFMGETHTKLFNLPRNGMFKLDGHLLHLDGINAWNADGLVGKSDSEKEKSRHALQTGLSEVKSKIGRYSSEFYAVLIMDGDRIGAQINQREDLVKRGLANFTNAVKEYFDPTTSKNPSNGVLIYAGGDDVLAFMPIDTALEAAQALRKIYDTAFSKAATNNDERATLCNFTMSAAIIFAQYKIPLRSVLRQAHHQLDDIAKEKNGRNSLAIATMKPGGIAYDWVSCWNATISDTSIDPISVMKLVATEISKPKSNYSTSFLYNIRERYAPLFARDDVNDPPDDDERLIDPVFADAKLMKAVLNAEYKKQSGKSKLKQPLVDAAISPLLTIAHPLFRKNESYLQAKEYNFDGALIARFIGGELMVNHGDQTKTDEANRHGK